MIALYVTTGPIETRIRIEVSDERVLEGYKLSGKNTSLERIEVYDIISPVWMVWTYLG